MPTYQGQQIGERSSDGQWVWMGNFWRQYGGAGAGEEGRTFGPGLNPGTQPGQLSSDGRHVWRDDSWQLVTTGDEPIPPAIGDKPPPITVGGGGDDTFSLADAIAQYKQSISAAAARERAEAIRLSTRNIGIAGRRGREALLATGRTGGEIEQLMGAGIEGGQRSLNDLLQQFAIQEQQGLAQMEQFGIGAQFTQEELNQRLLALTQQAGQFEQGFGEQVRQFDVTQRNQPKWWEAPLAGIGQGLGYGLTRLIPGA